MTPLAIFTEETIWPQFAETQIAGLFTPTHFIVLAGFFLILAVALLLSRRMGEKGVKRATLIAVVLSAVLFLAKSIHRAIVGDLGGVFPLYLSDLFLFAACLSLSKFQPLKRTGETYLAFASTTSGVVYILYPASALRYYPVWHPISVQGILFHWALLYVGILTLWKVYRPQLKDALYFFLFFTVFAIPAIILNELFPTYDLAYMYLRGPFFPFSVSMPYLFLVLSFLAQSIGLFWVWYGGYRLILYLRKRRKQP